MRLRRDIPKFTPVSSRPKRSFYKRLSHGALAIGTSALALVGLTSGSAKAGEKSTTFGISVRVIIPTPTFKIDDKTLTISNGKIENVSLEKDGIFYTDYAKITIETDKKTGNKAVTVNY